MTLDEAIKINRRTAKRMAEYGIPVWTEKDIKALGLGIEGLKRISNQRSGKIVDLERWLLGETEAEK